VIDRDFPYIKPRPEPVLHIMDLWSMRPEEILVVGDFIHDLECGNAAGAYSCFFHNPDTKSYSEFADFSVKSYDELEKLLIL
jgi:phosphoglycolate phosphatase-like HAD superfamily hydrolase